MKEMHWEKPRPKRRKPSERLEPLCSDDPNASLATIFSTSNLSDEEIPVQLDNEGNTKGVSVRYNPLPDTEWEVVISPGFKKTQSLLGVLTSEDLGFKVITNSNPKDGELVLRREKIGSSTPQFEGWVSTNTISN